MRSAPALACWPTAMRPANMRAGATSCTRYEEKARNVPRVMWPWRASQPPRASTPTWPKAGSACRAGTYTAWMRTSRMRERNTPWARWVSRSSSRCSWPKPFTTRTPVTASSTTPATSAACCWESQLAGNTLVRIRRATMNRRGITATATSVSSGDRITMITRETTSITRFPLMIGRKASRPWRRATSELARETSCPVCSSSWRAKSRRCRVS